MSHPFQYCCCLILKLKDNLNINKISQHFSRYKIIRKHVIWSRKIVMVYNIDHGFVRLYYTNRV